MGAQLQTFHTIDTITSSTIVVCIIATRVLIVILLLSLSQSSTVKVHVVDMSALRGGHIVFGRSRYGVIAIIWQWT